jgi:uncharacterized protein YndB with AHSA1/START domain
MPEDDDSLIRRVRVAPGPQRAWSLFTDRFAAWWPRAYTFSQERLAEIGIEPVAGGRCFERDAAGQDLRWGTVLAAEPPARLLFRWQITADRRIEPDPARASEVEVTFAPDGDGTQVSLSHRGFSRHGGDWRAYRAGMGSEQGWTYCLACFADLAGPAA